MDISGADAKFTCPICNHPLIRQENRLACTNNHSFDFAKQGYINLLPVQKKKSKNPGDNKSMILSRKAFMEKGFYDFIIPECINLINEHLGDRSEPTALLDIGCGDGYFTNQIFNQFSESSQRYGMDISKEAIKVAAKRSKTTKWFVASSNNIPLAPGSINVILKINSPLDYQTARHKLDDNGIIISITPGEKHLYELKQIIYPKAKLHQPESCPEHFCAIKTVNLMNKLELQSKEDIHNLFMMTPLFWNASKSSREKVEQLTFLTTTIAFDINIWRHQASI